MRPFFTTSTERDRVRSRFLEALCRDFGAIRLAKAIAALPDRQFDSLCELARSGYSGVIDPIDNEVKF